MLRPVGRISGKPTLIFLVATLPTHCSHLPHWVAPNTYRHPFGAQLRPERRPAAKVDCSHLPHWVAPPPYRYPFGAQLCLASNPLSMLKSVGGVKAL